MRLPARPRTSAFGGNDTLNVLDVGGLLDVERYRRVNVDALEPAALYLDRALLAPERNTGFLRQCVAHFPNVNFAEQASGRIYLRVVDGKPAWIDREVFARALQNADARAAILDVLPSAADAASSASAPLYLRDIAGDEPIRTLGAWGDAR